MYGTFTTCEWKESIYARILNLNSSACVFLFFFVFFIHLYYFTQKQVIIMQIKVLRREAIRAAKERNESPVAFVNKEILKQN